MGRLRVRAGTCGLLAVAAGVAASELPRAVTSTFPSLTGSGGQWIIRSVPGDVVHLAVESVGTADKPLLVGAIVAVLLLGGAATAPLAQRRPLAVDLVGVGVAGLGCAAAGTRALVPAAMAAAVAVGTRRASLAVLSSGEDRRRTTPDPPAARVDSSFQESVDELPTGPSERQQGTPEHPAAGHLEGQRTTAFPPHAGPARSLRRTPDPLQAGPARSAPVMADPLLAGALHTQRATEEPSPAEATSSHRATADPLAAHPLDTPRASAEPTAVRATDSQRATADASPAGATRSQRATAEPPPVEAISSLLATAEPSPAEPTRGRPARKSPLGPTSSRRRFLAAGSVAAGTTVVALGGAAALRRVGGPAPRAALPPADGLGAAATQGLAVPGLSPLVTPTSAFYRIDVALVVPSVDAAGWRLRVHGMVAAPFEPSYADLLAEPLVERDITLCCVSNDVGGRLVGTARWTGVRLADLLRRAGIDPAATQLVGRSVDGFTVGFPVAAALDGREALVAVGMNGEPLRPKHGFPARLVVPGLYGFVSATKWLTELKLTTWEAFDPYWVERGWSREAPVKVSSRIDVPRDYTRVAPGRQAIAGVAWAPTSGIAAVSFRVDDGSWQEARLGPSLGDDAWRQWTAEWDPPPGAHEIGVRAVTADGLVQTEDRRSAFPNGASGLHRSHVRVVPAG